jgi:hypothetical protein
LVALFCALDKTQIGNESSDKKSTKKKLCLLSSSFGYLKFRGMRFAIIMALALGSISDSI